MELQVSRRSFLGSSLIFLALPMLDANTDKPARPRRKLLVVTDVGKDIDDTVALAMIAASGEFELVGVVTSGGNTTNRAKFARQLLRVFGVKDDQCHVIAGFDPKQPPNLNSRCYGHLPNTDGLPLSCVQDDDVIDPADATEQLLQLVRKNSGLTIIGIGPLTPLRIALESDDRGILKANVGSLHVQGCDVDGKPDSQSFNFREDMEAANVVFEHLRGNIPFHFVGKFAAYQVPLRTHNVLAWDEARPETTKSETPSWLKMVVNQMKAFRDSSTELYFDLYPLDVARAEQDGRHIAYMPRNDNPAMKQPRLMTEDWYMYLKDDVVMKPYDPLVVASLIAPELFTTITDQSDKFIGNTKEQPGVSDSRECEALIGELVKKASQMMMPAPGITDPCGTES